MTGYHKHYVAIDQQNRILHGFSDAFRQPADTDICINEKGGYQFRLFPGGEENPVLHEHGVPFYRYENGEVVKRTGAEIEAELAAIAADAVPSEEEDTAALLVDHEYRLTMLELGLTDY